MNIVFIQMNASLGFTVSNSIVLYLIVGGLTIFFALCSLYRRVAKKTELDREKESIAVVSLLLTFLLIYAMVKHGPRVPGHWLERAQYKAMLYVRLYPDDGSVKSYKVPALIHASDVTCGEEGEQCRDYQIEYAIMPNGGRIVFYSANDTSKLFNGFDPENTLKLDEKVTLLDLKDREWGVELTSELAEK